MEIIQPFKRIHPLMAGAAVSVILVSLVGIAAMTGALPSSRATPAPATASQATPASVPASAAALLAASAQPDARQAAVAPEIRNDGAKHKTVVHRPAYLAQTPGQPNPQAAAYPQPLPANPHPQPAPVAQNSPIGIGVGAVVGGLLGNQVGGGNGKTLATIAGAVGGGYLGNEIAKRNP
ncbi:MAG: glycine zipper 2TM domain-containing protein [Polaromonas sp.]|nr:glycine zipper 2TM domain-containing protein [Polaromonas sp.]